MQDLLWLSLEIYILKNRIFRGNVVVAHQGSGCDSVGRAVASDTRDPRFESRYWQTFIYQLYNRKYKNEEKETRNGLSFKKGCCTLVEHMLKVKRPWVRIPLVAFFSLLIFSVAQPLTAASLMVFYRKSCLFLRSLCIN